MWGQDTVKSRGAIVSNVATKTSYVSLLQDYSSSVRVMFPNFFGFRKKTPPSPPNQHPSKVQWQGITIIIENSSVRKLTFKESKSWSGNGGIYQIPERINPGELVIFDFRKESLTENQGVVVYQIIDTHRHDYLLIMGWSKPNNAEDLPHAFVKIMLTEDYQKTSLEKIHTWINTSSGQSHSAANGYSACAKAITRGSIPLWVNCLNNVS